MKVNINKCYPELTERQRQRLIKRAAEEQFIGFAEAVSAYWDPSMPSRIAKVENAEAIKKAAAKGRGVLCVSAHYTNIDVSVIPSQTLELPIDITYRPFNNAVLDKVVATQRKRKVNDIISNKEIRRMLKSLKDGNVLLYLADQDYGRRHSVFAPFFNIPAATIYVTSWLARASNAPVLTATIYRDADHRYTLRFSDVLPDFPSDDPIADATKINRLLEDSIRKQPAQYMWVHRRFKTRPEGEQNFYS